MTTSRAALLRPGTAGSNDVHDLSPMSPGTAAAGAPPMSLEAVDAGTPLTARRWRNEPVLRLVTDAHGREVGLAVPSPSVEAAAGRDAGLAAVRPRALGPDQALRDAMAMVARALEGGPDCDDGEGAALRARVRLLEELAGMTTAGLATTLAALRRAGAIESDGASSTAAWVKANTSRSARDAARTGRLADNLEELPATARALASGQLTPESADAMVTAARDGRLGGPEQVEKDLLELATSGPPEQLRSGIRQRQQTADGAAMLRDERRQHVARHFNLTRRETGMWGVHGELPDEVGQQFATALEAFDQSDPDGTPLLQRRRPEQRRADALAAMVGVTMDRGFAPGTGGIVRPHISVIVAAPTLTTDLTKGHADRHGVTSDPQAQHGDRSNGRGVADGRSVADGRRVEDRHADHGEPGIPAIDDPVWARLPAGDLEWGGRLSPQAVRRICCDADVTRIIMTPDSQVLDVGRTTRTWSQPQRRAVNARDRHCRGPSCDRPIGWTQIHHIRWWKRDRGPTNLDNGIALCTYCHHLVHDRGWTVALDPETSVATWTSPIGQVIQTRPPTRDVHPWAPARQTERTGSG